MGLGAYFINETQAFAVKVKSYIFHMLKPDWLQQIKDKATEKIGSSNKANSLWRSNEGRIKKPEHISYDYDVE